MPPSVSLFDVEPILDTLQSGRLLLTSNQRLAARISNAYVLLAAHNRRTVVETPNIHALKHWVDQLWLGLLADGYPPALELRVLDMHQELHIWESIISDTEVGQALLRPAATAQQAASAYRLMADWQLTLQDPAIVSQLHNSEDARIWQQWALQFDAYCAQYQLLSSSRVPEVLLKAFQEERIESQGDIHLLGFLDIPPLYQALLQAAGNPIHCAFQRPPATTHRVQCESETQEITAAAVWAKQVLKNDPAARVAIVIPDLNRQRAVIERIVMEVFEPGYNFASPAQSMTNADSVSGMQRRALPFNISAGYALSEAPLIRTALNVLQLTKSEVDLETLEAVLHSPFVSISAEEHSSVARVITRCRLQKAFSINMSEFRSRASQELDAADAPWPFATALQEVANFCRQQQWQQSRPRRLWLELFEKVLQLVGWPGNRPVDSIEYQQLQQWQQVQKYFTGLGVAANNESITFSAALTQLSGILANHIFQPQTADSSLQVLGTLEASGLQFSHLWLASMSSRQWPPPPAPNPLLPLSLQQHYAMPHCNAHREFEYAEKLTAQFLHAASHVVVSAPLIIDDNPVSFSRLYDSYPLLPLSKLLGRELDSLLPTVEIRRRYLEAGAVETFEPGDAPAVESDGPVRGGVAIFTDQSACPFRAFARHRLSIDALETPELGLSAADRGSILHRALELFWNSVKDQDTLLELSQEQLYERCLQSSQYAVEQHFARAVSSLGERFRSLEVERLTQTLSGWMNVEKTRSHFKVVETEERRPFVFAGLACEARIDRVDQLDDGSLLIIDYKSGSATTADWWGNRPQQPQLPLYAVIAEKKVPADNVSAIMFARVPANKITGAGSEDCPEPSLQWQGSLRNASGQYTWDQQKKYWQSVLSALATDFINGKAGVDPWSLNNKSADTCRFCELQALCRIDHEELQA